MKFFFVAISIFWSLCSWGQTTEISGRIKDAKTNEPLAFVNVIYNSGKHGVVSNIDGYYNIRNTGQSRYIIFSLIGYETKTINLDTIHSKVLDVVLTSKPTDLSEVIVTPEINPAFRIINKVSSNRNQNNPEKLSSFSYSSYNRMHFTRQNEHLAGLNIDSVQKLEKSYLLLMEFISERKFKFPDKDQERIVASRVSGFKDPSFTLLATQLQSFSFYNDFFTLFDKYYINPISPGSTSRYSFLLEDTFLTETFDTLFVISFKPIQGKNFEGLKGILYINTNGYAIQNVIAEAYSTNDDMSVKIQQRYELINRQKWFPTQLNTQLTFKNLKNNKDQIVVGTGKSYIRNISIDQDMSATRFSNIILSVAPEAYFQTDSLWKQYRSAPLSRRDSLTYQILDSIGRAKNLDQRLEIWETLSTGFIPLGYVNVDLRRFVNYNRKEGFRVGLGLQTNNHLSKYFSVGGHYAYGITDKKSKYGAFMQLFPSWTSDFRFSINFLNDVIETGGYRFVDDQFLFSTELYRNFMVNRMDKIKGFESALTFRALKYMKFKISLANASRSLNGYSYINPEDTYLESYNVNEAGIGVKFTFNEKFVQTPRGRKISTGTMYPVLWLNFKQGMELWNGSFNYHKYESRLSKTFTTKRFGKTSITLVSGKADKPLPIGLLYNGHANYSGFSFEAENSFGTMRMNEFYSSEFVSGYFRQNFENLLFSKGNFKPEISIAFNAGFGRMQHPEYHEGIIYKTMGNGFYETGIIFNKIINQTLFGYGFAVYYRLGSYAFLKTADNFSFKMVLNFNFQ